MPELPDERLVSIPRPELEDLHQTLTSVFHFSLSWDLFTQYRELTNQARRSPITREINRAVEIVEEYLKDGEDEQVPT